MYRDHLTGSVRTPIAGVEVIIWTDGFEPNNTKQNRGSVWSMFVSIGTPEDNYHAGANTFLVAMGRSKGSHDEAVAELQKELRDLSTAGVDVYLGAIGRKVRVVPIVYCLLQDSPERSHFCHVASGNSIYTPIWGFTGDIRQLQQMLPSCSACHQCHLSGRDPPTECAECFDWEFVDQFFSVPDQYPAGDAITEDGVKYLINPGSVGQPPVAGRCFWCASMSACPCSAPAAASPCGSSPSCWTRR